MNIKRFLAVIIAFIGLTYFTSQDASANAISPNDELISQVKIFDENNEQIPYSTEELKEIIKFIPDDSTTIKTQSSSIASLSSWNYSYNTGEFSFSNNIWIAGGAGFRNPVDILITPKGTAKAFTFYIFHTDGTQARRIDLPGGWSGDLHMDLTSLTRNYSYKFQFVNYFTGTLYFTNTRVAYDG